MVDYYGNDGWDGDPYDHDLAKSLLGQSLVQRCGEGGEHEPHALILQEEEGADSATFETPDGHTRIELVTSVSDFGNRVPTMYSTAGGQRDLIYFFRGYVFHPGARPKSVTKNVMGKRIGNRNNRRVFIVDTGWDSTSFMPSPGQPHPDPIDYDWFVENGKSPNPEDDVVRGHGPAIYDLIRQLMGSETELHLRRIRYEEGSLGGPLQLATDNQANPDEFVRGFDARALLSTLAALGDELCEGDIVVMSLGTVTSNQEDLADDPVRIWMEQIVCEKGTIDFVVAAGNHATTEPSWPAGYQTYFGGNPSITAVGSSPTAANDDNSQAAHDFSARGPWVKCWRNGQDVPVQRSAVTAANTRGTTWTGTSFAAPIRAAEMAMEGTTTEGQPGDADEDAMEEAMSESGSGGLIDVTDEEMATQADHPASQDASTLLAKLKDAAKNVWSR